MKIKQIESILKAEKTIIVIETEACQWLGNGSAFYPVYNLPKLTKENIFTIFDIAEDKRDKFYFEERALPSGINFEDIDGGEQMLERGSIEIYANGRVLEPLKTSLGVAFINMRYLKPFADAEGGFNLYERIDQSGNIYIAVKCGFILLGIISPYDLVSKQFIDTLQTLLDLSKVTLQNKEQKAVERYGKQMSLDEEETDK